MKRFFVFFIIILLLIPGGAMADRSLIQRETGDPTEKKLEVEDLSIELGVILNIRIREQNCKMAGYYFGSIDKKP